MKPDDTSGVWECRTEQTAGQSPALSPTRKWNEYAAQFGYTEAPNFTRLFKFKLRNRKQRCQGTGFPASAASAAVMLGGRSQ
ncbi:hypothetical protein DPEC_G00349260 [Dallia pectoralis]|uniref:Uncharacterized protein n=1 Tax=Dallia pectoralis TaxID=75939 RepID=A0ACC2F1E0_DALPE|nr:hypothetical protein DPEC_G00349260 [Dallia pectoralis]